LGDALYRFENSFTLGDVTATEGYWFFIDERAAPSDVMSAVQSTVIGWFNEPVPDTDISRASLMPEQARFTSNRILAFAVDFLAIESELFQSIFDVSGESPDTALPSVISKEIEIAGSLGGRGNFNRIHTSFHPESAVLFGDARRCTADYQSKLVQVYAFLFDLINLTYVGFDAFPDPIVVPCTVARVSSTRSSSNQVLSRSVEQALSVRSSSDHWGTMRRRGAVVKH
jgi:hypothetical protein